MKSTRILYPLTVLFAGCAFIYTLVLTQTLSALDGAPVIRYSLALALFLLALEYGIFLSQNRQSLVPVSLAFLGFETGLTLAGGFSFLSVYWLGMVWPRFPGLNVLMYVFIALIAFLKGLETAVIGTAEDKESRAHIRSSILSYSGFFAGGMIFIFLLLPGVGLPAALFGTTAFHAAACMLFFPLRKQMSPRQENLFYRFLYVQLFSSAIFMLCLLNVDKINSFWS